MKTLREAKQRSDNIAATDQINRKRVGLLAEAMDIRDPVFVSPDLSLHQLGKLVRLSWLSLRLTSATIDGRQLARRRNPIFGS